VKSGYDYLQSAIVIAKRKKRNLLVFIVTVEELEDEDQ
jgi:hypothetical protein